MRYDCIIIGSGPAGLSAALNLKVYHKNFLWFGNSDVSDKVEKAEQINNYPGLYGSSGEALAERFRAHQKAMELEVMQKMVSGIYPMGGYYNVVAENSIYETKSVLLAMGVVQSHLYSGEAEFLGRGVSYCATCDGNLYRGRRIAVIAFDKRFEPEIRFLSELAEKVYLFLRYRDYSEFGGNVEVITTAPREIVGGFRVEELVLAEESRLQTDGIFILRSSIAPTTLLSGLQMEDGHIGVNRRQETNLPGVYAAGDCTGKPYQYAKAVGEGNVAAHSVLEYLGEK